MPDEAFVTLHEHSVSLPFSTEPGAWFLSLQGIWVIICVMTLDYFSPFSLKSLEQWRNSELKLSRLGGSSHPSVVTRN